VSAESTVGTVKVEFASVRVAVVALIGEHDLDSRAALRATLAYAGEERNLLIDLSQCTFIDSAIISLLLATQRTLGARHARCELFIPARAAYVKRLFAITGIAGLFRIHGSRSAALSSMADPAVLLLSRDL
jgi:anti-anti-sigma factor